MDCKTSLLITVLLTLPGLRAQQTTSTLDFRVIAHSFLPQAATPSMNLENDPGFKRLSPEAQKWIMTGAAPARNNGAKPFDNIYFNMAQSDIHGMDICGVHTADGGTLVNALAVDYSYPEEAISVRWLDPDPGIPMRTAIFTTELRCIASDTTVVDGKWIVRLLPNSLAMSKERVVAYEAIYLNRNETPVATEHRGVFIGNRFLFDLNPAKASPPDSYNADSDFAWDDTNNRIVPKPGIVLTTSAPSPKAAQPECAAQAIPHKKNIFVPKPLKDQLGKLKRPTPSLPPCPATPSTQK